MLNGKTLVTLPGRITRLKGHEDFLRILAQLAASHAKLHGLIVGEADPGKQRYLAELKSLVDSLGLKERVSFTGHRADLREIMSISHTVLSLSKRPEAFGRTVLEALSLGIPVIAYAHGGAIEIMRALLPAGLTQAQDIAAAAGLLDRFLRDRPAVPGDHGYSLQRMLAGTMAVYEMAAPGKAAPQAAGQHL
jgi:glycosyltransferase involved in cell wall biosynthesis